MPRVDSWLDYCLGKTGAWPDEPWEGDVVAKVGPRDGGAKIFAFLGTSDEQGSLGVKCGDREEADLWLQRYPDRARRMPYIGQHGWNTFQLDRDHPRRRAGRTRRPLLQAGGREAAEVAPTRLAAIR